MFNILFQDDHVVAIHKPVGMLVHRSDQDVHERRIVLPMLSDQLGRYLYPVHRLDKATSGVLIFALSSKAASALQAQFESHRVKKRYVAVTRGYLTGEGEIDHALNEKRDQRRSGGAVRAGPWPGKPSTTRYQGLATAEVPIACGRYSTSRYSLVGLQPLSGRRHQLRRHLKHISHPIIGDTTYGQGSHNRLFRDHFDCHRLLLCALNIGFEHPIECRAVSIGTELDEDFQSVVAKLGWD